MAETISLDDLDRMLGGAPPRTADPQPPPAVKSGSISIADLDAAMNPPAGPAAAPQDRGGITWGDVGQTLKAGAGDVVQGVGWLAKKTPIAAGINALDDLVGNPLPSAMRSDAIERYGREMSQKAEAAMSPAAREAMGKEFVTDGPDGLGLGPALTDPAAIGLTALRSGPSMAATVIPGAGAARGVQALGGVVSKVAPRLGAALARPFVAGAAGYGAAEGALTGGQNAAQSEQAVLAMPIETLRTSPEFAALVEQVGGEDAAREKLAADIASGVAWKTGLVTGILGGVAGGGLEHLIQGGARGIMRAAGKQALTEAATEAPQSAAEQTIQNLEEGRADPSRPVGQGVANQAVAGGVVGGLTGGVMGGGAGAISPRTKAGRAAAEAQADTALPAAEVIGAEPETPAGPISIDALNEMLNAAPGPVKGAPVPASITLGQAATEADQAAADAVAPGMQSDADRLVAEQDRIDALNAKAAADRARREKPARAAADIAAIQAAGEDLTAADRDFAARVADPAYNPADEEPPAPISAPTSGALRFRGTPDTDARAPREGEAIDAWIGRMREAFKPPADAPSLPSLKVIDRDVAVRPDGAEEPVAYGIVDLADLTTSHDGDFRVNPAYPAEVQPRDRSRPAARLQVEEMAQKLDPRLLDRSPSVTDGAPIVGPDGIVESGNGRVMALRKAYEAGLPTAERYRAFLQERGYPVEGLAQPVLVRVREGQAALGDRAAFARVANERTTASMSATERARADAAAITDDALSRYVPGELGSAANRQFLRGVIDQIVTPADRGSIISADGALSTEGRRRVEDAIFAKAYGSDALTAAVAEAADSDIRAIGGALRDVAPAWSLLRSEAARAQIPAGMDITPHLVAAVQTVRRARAEGRPLAEFVNQADMFGAEIDPTAALMLRLMFRDDALTKPVSRARLADDLRYYVEEARKATAGTDLLGQETNAADVLAQTARQSRGATLDIEQPGLAGAAEGGVASRGTGSGRGAGPDGRGPVRFERGSEPAEAGPREGVTQEELGDGAVVAEYEAAPALVAKREAVARNIGMLVARMTGDRAAAVRVADRLTSLGQDITGAMIPVDRLVAVSMASPDPVGTARHETIHLLREIGAISEADWSTLTQGAERGGWLERHDIERRYPSLDRDAQLEEAVASAFADYRRGRPTGIAAIDLVFNAIAKFLDRVAGAARAALGREATAKDLFRRIEAGRMAQAAEAPRSAPVRFERGEVDSAQGRQQLAQGWIAKGQPIDRALRMPFDFFGGLTEDGQWKPGLALTKAAKRVITEARFSDRSSFRFMNDWIHQARAGLIDRYGLADDYITRDRWRERDERKTLMQGADFLKAMAEREMTPAEARALHGMLVGDGVASGDWGKLAGPIRQAIDELGAEAVELGLVSPESYERNRGTYLHRSYLKHEADQSSLARIASAYMGSRRKKIIGDQLKGRGMFLEVAADRLPDGADGIGDRVRVADLLADDGKVKRRQYLADGAALPDGYTDKGTWTIRQGKGDRAVIWRDFTKAERERMGEILDARYAIGKTYLTMAHDLATGRFYRDIAGNPEWARTDEPPEGTWKDAGDVSRFKRDPDVAWVKVPDTAIAKTGGKKRWGALSGKFVRAEIWADINELAEMQRSTFWRTLLSQWKLNKTVRSPVVHMNNVISNTVFADLADVRWQDIVSGVRMLAGKNQDFRDAVEHGAFGADQVSQEMRKDVLEPLLKELMAQGAGQGARGRFAMINTIADKIWSAVKTVDQGMQTAYRLEDDVFRAAAYMRRRALGDGPEAAANFARDQFLDYDIRAPWVNAARNSLLPFISYTYRAVPVIARSIAARPWKMAKYATLAYAANALFRGLAGDTPEDEDRQRRSMREDERGWITTLGVPISPRLMRMPFDDPTGAPVYLDIRRFVPAGDVFDTTQGQAPVPAPLQFGGPLAMAFEAMLNKTAFDGKEIYNKTTDSPAEVAGKYAGWLWKSWVPSAAWVPGSWYWTKIGDAIAGVRDRGGKQYSVPLAAASSVGIKLRPQDIDQNLAMRAHEYDRIGRDLKFEMTTIARDQERGALSPAEAEKAVARIIEKQQRLAERRAETFR